MLAISINLLNDIQEASYNRSKLEISKYLYTIMVELFGINTIPTIYFIRSLISCVYTNLHKKNTESEPIIITKKNNTILYIIIGVLSFIICCFIVLYLYKQLK